MSPSSTRWCPTPEQVMILEELYRRGVRTPNATQIQRITAHLSFYGKIQGKNVFYWFQNHKARDRQKLRKKLLLAAKQYNHQYPYPYPYPYQQPDPQTHLLPPSPTFHHLDLSHAVLYSPLHNLHAQGSGISSEEAPDGVVMRGSWRPADCVMRSCGHDSTMTTVAAGPSGVPCSRNKPLETLQLFPLRSPAANDEQQTNC